MKQDRSILLIHPGGIGDVLLSLPAIFLLRRRYAGHQVVLLTRSDIGRLLQVCGVIDRILTTESGDLACLMGGGDQVPPSLQELLRTTVYVVGWLRDSDGVLQATVRRFGVTQVAFAPATPCKGVHQSARFLELLEQEGYREGLPSHLVIPQALREAGRKTLLQAGIVDGHNVVMCHPGSGSLHKCLPADTIAAVLRSLRQMGMRPVIVGGPADSDAVGRVRALGCRDMPAILEQSLTTVASVLANCNVFLGHDSGLSHLAGAMQIPTVAFFGPTDPRQWAPLGEHVSIIRGPACACLTWKAVQACVEKSCLVVSIEEITDACRAMLNRYRTVTKS